MMKSHRNRCCILLVLVALWCFVTENVASNDTSTEDEFNLKVDINDYDIITTNDGKNKVNQSTLRNSKQPNYLKENTNHDLKLNLFKYDRYENKMNISVINNSFDNDQEKAENIVIKKTISNDGQQEKFRHRRQKTDGVSNIDGLENKNKENLTMSSLLRNMWQEDEDEEEDEIYTVDNNDKINRIKQFLRANQKHGNASDIEETFQNNWVEGNNETDEENLEGISDNDEDINLMWKKYVLDMDETDSDLTTLDHRIVGGQLIAIQSVPYLVTILRRKREICGGTLISMNHLLTAAHCVTNRAKGIKGYTFAEAKEFSIRYGSNSSTSGGYEMDFERIFIHPEYLKERKYSLYMDLAVVKLNGDINSESMVHIAKLPEKTITNELREWEKQGLECVVAGWGSSVARPASRRKRSLLLGTKLALLDIHKCQEIFDKTSYKVSEKAHICTYSEDTDACQGDSGGGIYKDDMILGVTSWGIGCAAKGVPGVFGRIDTSLDFIQEALSVASDMSPRHNEQTSESANYTKTSFLQSSLHILISLIIIVLVK